MDPPRPKRRKWDVAAPPPQPAATQQASILGAAAQASAAIAAAVLPAGAVQTNDAPPAGVALGAAEIAKRINEDLAAKGFLRAPAAAAAPEPPKEIVREVCINDAPPGIRMHLTRKQQQEGIGRRTNTVLTIKGRYYPPGAPNDGKEKALCLRITPASAAGETDEEKEKAVDAGAAEVELVLRGQPPQQQHQQQQQQHHQPPRHAHPLPPPMPQSYNAAPPPGQAPQGPQSYNAAPPPGQAPLLPPQAAAAAAAAAAHRPQPNTTKDGKLSIKLYAVIPDPPGFNLQSRLAGPSGSYLAHIQREAGAAVTLQGQHPSPQPLHLLIVAPDREALDKAQQLAQNLIDTTRAAADAFGPSVGQHQHPGGPYAPPHPHGRPPNGGPPPYGAPPPPGPYYAPPPGPGQHPYPPFYHHPPPGTHHPPPYAPGGPPPPHAGGGPHPHHMPPPPHNPYGAPPPQQPQASEPNGAGGSSSAQQQQEAKRKFSEGPNNDGGDEQ